jgi:2-(1,2-epoxy-1,2-dihydrophenyl)acetyl-CoA isomerase
VVASINGTAAGGGATIALACDLRIASERARFVFPFSRIGITPEFGASFLLPRVVGLGKAMELLLLADTIDAGTAERAGLVNMVVPHEQLATATAGLVQRLLDKPADALGAIKALLHRGLVGGLDAQLELEATALGKAFTSDEHRSAVAAFLRRKTSRADAASGM